MKRYNQSELALFLKCGIAWEFRYLKGIVSPPKAALTIGSAVDSAVTKNLSQKIESKLDMPKEAVLDAFSTDFDSRAKETEWDEEGDAGKAKDVGVRLVTAHHEILAPKIDPETVQETFLIETDAGYALGGTIDLVEKSGVVVDTKTSKLAYKEDAISRAIQPAMYDFAYESLRGKPAEAFRYDVLIKPTAKREAGVQQVKAKVTSDDRAWLFNGINQMHKAIQAGVVLPAPDGAWWCSREWCGYASQCPKFKKN